MRGGYVLPEWIANNDPPPQRWQAAALYLHSILNFGRSRRRLTAYREVEDKVSIRVG